MQDNFGHAQRVCDGAGVLAAGSAKTGQGIVGHVITALYGDFFYGAGHALHRDFEEPFGYLFGLALGPDLGGQGGEGLSDRDPIKPLVSIRPENRGEIVRHQFSDHHIGVGHRQRPAVSIAGWPRVGAGRLRADAEARAVKCEQRTAAGGNCVNAHHRCAHAHACDLGLKGTLIVAIEMGNVGRGAAHVKADDFVEPGHGAGLDRAHHPAGRAGQYRVLAGKQPGIGQPAGRLHKHQPAAIAAF